MVAEGLVYRQSVLAFAKNPASNGGTIGVREADALMLLRMRAQTEQLPLIVLYDGAAIDADHAGAGFRAFSAVSDQRARVAGLEIAVVFGESVGTDALLASLADIVVTTGTEAGVSLAGPELVRRVSNEVVSLADLAFEEGIASVQFDDEVTAILALRRLLSMLVDQGSTRLRDPEERDSPGLNYLAGRASYDMREILKSVADYGDVFELKAQTTSSVITALIQMDGFTCGVVANQPLVKLGLLTTEGMGKAADFIAFCARRRIPLLRFLDCPGILPGRMEARNRPLSAAARLLELEARLTIPPITVVTGKAIGLAAVVMGMSSTSGGRCLRWPQAAIDMRDGRDGKTELEHRNLELIVPGETRAHIIKAIRETMEARK
ncbi:hypothetical protein LB556_22475 [Mesorhizobium sp. ES1-4]|nr:hypothetical protein [Mesorhizobium sp. ES1-4]